MNGYPRPWPSPPPDDPPSNCEIYTVYDALRADCNELEQLIEDATVNATLDQKTLKQLDKSITVMKAGFKIAKRAIKRRAGVAAIRERENG